MAILRSSDEKDGNSEPLIPGLPDEIAELCLLHVPYPYQALIRSVSSSWNKTITDPCFLLSRKSQPFLFVFAFDKSTARIQWQALDPRSRRWFVLPRIPCLETVSPESFACASIPRQGKLFVMGGMRANTESSVRTTVIYHTSTNQWSQASPMLTARSFFAAANVGDKIFAVGGSGPGVSGPSDSISAVERYDPKTGAWASVAKMRAGLARYDAAVVGRKICVTEGWTWPFVFSPRGGVYDAETDTWQEMSAGMREGWTGLSAVVDDRLFVISEHGDCPMKVYHSDSDTWEYVGGQRFPCDAVQRPFAVGAMEGRIYVVSHGMNVAIGRIYEVEKGKPWVEWEVVEAPRAFHGLSPSTCQVVYA
ncbi:F-box protein AFR [Malania oleifera]|uniref:F-box protein AFR n=1 Tax=Malania oleifera TaxID=397392 RepID=UPI0025AEB2A5|nr:F-box protein AFR [Malania oleifera]